jgi:ferredoxin-NADP reductase
LLLQPNRHWAGVAPGQHVNISAEIDGRRVTRSYSPSAANRRDGRVEITVKEIAGGKLSGYLCRDAKVGDVLDIGAAFGETTLRESGNEARLFLAAGSGITPLMAMLRAQAVLGFGEKLTLMYWSRSRDEFCFVEELRALAASHENFDVRFMLTRDAAQADDEREGRLCEALLADHVADVSSRQVFACGPGGFVEQARALLSGRAKSFQAEAFTPPATSIEEGGTVQVTLSRSQRTLTLPRGQSLLTALEAAGIKPASGCRMGICNTCACGKRSGTTRQLHTGEVVNEPVSALRLCVNSAASDLVLEL